MNEIVEMQCLRCRNKMQVMVTEFYGGKPRTPSHPAEPPEATFTIQTHKLLNAPSFNCSFTNHTMSEREFDRVHEAIVSHFASKLEQDFEG